MNEFLIKWFPILSWQRLKSHHYSLTQAVTSKYLYSPVGKETPTIYWYLLCATLSPILICQSLLRWGFSSKKRPLVDRMSEPTTYPIYFVFRLLRLNDWRLPSSREFLFRAWRDIFTFPPAMIALWSNWSSGASMMMMMVNACQQSTAWCCAVYHENSNFLSLKSFRNSSFIINLWLPAWLVA